MLLDEKDLISGLMVAFTDAKNKDNYPKDGFSSDRQCPNKLSSLYKDKNINCSFNPLGSGLRFEDFKIPVMLLTSQSEVDEIIQCFEKHNMPMGDAMATYPLCAAQLEAYMHGAGNSEICLRRQSMGPRTIDIDQFCGLLGGMSSIAFLTEAMSPNKRPPKTIIVMARSDSFSLFKYTQPGASNPVTALTALLAIARILNEYKEDIAENGFNVLFMAVTGESFEYIGSQRIVYDMEHGHFPNKTMNSMRMGLKDISLIIELSQFAKPGTVYVHVHSSASNNNNNTARFEDQLKMKDMFEMADDAIALPPSSSHSFIRKEADVPVIVLGDFETKFETNYYNSYLDTHHNPDYNLANVKKFVKNVSSEVSEAIFNFTTGKPAGDNFSKALENEVVDQVMDCMLINPKCDLFFTIASPGNIEALNETESPYSFFVGVYSEYNIEQMQYLIRQLLAYYTSTSTSGNATGLDLDEEECSEAHEGKPWTTYWINGKFDPKINNWTGMCINSTAQYQNASSLAQEILDYSYNDVDWTKYAAWTESVSGSGLKVRIFLQPSFKVQRLAVFAGVMTTAIWFAATFIIYRRAEKIFLPLTKRGTKAE